MAGPLRIGLIGTGSISAIHRMALGRASDKVALTAVCDVREDAVREFAARAGVDRVYTDAETMLREAVIDAVDICASHFAHRDLAVAAAEAGKHVLLEKPMANTLEECREIIAAAEHAGVVLMVGQQLRHVPSYVGVKRLIEKGALGSLWGARSDSWLPVIMSRRAPPGDRPADDSLSWRLDGERAGGGSLIWNGTHFIDLFRYFLGDARRVFGTCWEDHPAFTRGAEDRVMATIEFESGAVAHLSNSWTTRAPWQFQFMLLGDDGSVYTPVVTDGDALAQHEAPAWVSSPQHDITSAEGRVQRAFVPVEAPGDLYSDNPYVNEIAHFADCCASGEAPVSSGRDNLGTMQILHGIYRSSREGAMVEIADL